MKIIFLLMMLPGCADNVYREYNREDQQDRACHESYGGRRGYCDAYGRGHK